MDLELVGPRVSVDRNGTADRGGGQLVLKHGKLLVRARNLERLLGDSSAIDHIQLVDLGRVRATVRFVDGQVWSVQSEQGESLTGFFRQVEAAAGRVGLLRDPPRISELVRAAATPARMRLALLTALALLAYFPLVWLGGLAPSAGVVLAALGTVALSLGVAAFALRDEIRPALLGRVRPWVSWPWLAAALAAAVAGSVGYAEASAREARADAKARALAQAQQQAQAAAAREQTEARARRAQADTLTGQLLDAMRSERFRDAKVLRDRIEALAPGHDAVKQVSPQIDRALADLDERERAASVTRGIARARAVSADPLACETAKPVADAHDLLRRARPSDADYDAAQRALEDLERCRKRVRARFAQSAEESRRRARMLAAAQIEADVRRLGSPARVSLSGRARDVLRIEAHELDAGAVQRILDMNTGKNATFESARTEEGFARIELRGERFKRDVRLRPVPPEALIVPVLESFGLARPLTLQEHGP